MGIRLALVGPRPSGKSAYLAAFSSWNKQYRYNSNISVVALNEDARKIQDDMQHIILSGEQLEPPRLMEYNYYPDYNFEITIRERFLLNKTKIYTISVSARIIPGEIFEICNNSYNQAADDTLSYLASSNMNSLIIIDASSYRKDLECAKVVQKYLSSLDSHNDNFINSNGRIAVSLSKCDSPDVWINRQNPDKLFSQRFPHTKQALEQWANARGVKAKYFTSSAFGCYGTNNCEPNTRIISKYESGISSVLKEPAYWRPYGLIAPIYWLDSGRDLNGLDYY
jgi:hypothetical protein